MLKIAYITNSNKRKTAKFLLNNVKSVNFCRSALSHTGKESLHPADIQLTCSVKRKLRTHKCFLHLIKVVHSLDNNCYLFIEGDLLPPF